MKAIITILIFTISTFTLTISEGTINSFYTPNIKPLTNSFGNKTIVIESTLTSVHDTTDTKLVYFTDSNFYYYSTHIENAIPRDTFTFKYERNFSKNSIIKVPDTFTVNNPTITGTGNCKYMYVLDTISHVLYRTTIHGISTYYNYKYDLKRDDTFKNDTIATNVKTFSFFNGKDNAIRFITTTNQLVMVTQLNDTIIIKTNTSLSYKNPNIKYNEMKEFETVSFSTSIWYINNIDSCIYFINYRDSSETIKFSNEKYTNLKVIYFQEKLFIITENTIYSIYNYTTDYTTWKIYSFSINTTYPIMMYTPTVFHTFSNPDSSFTLDTTHTSTSIETSTSKSSLTKIYPNPCNPSSRISFSLSQESLVSIKLYTVNGNMVKKVVESRMLPGTHSVMLNSNLPSGKYFTKVSINNKSTTIPFTVIK
jgi:hypothetical protein